MKKSVTFIVAILSMLAIYSERLNAQEYIEKSEFIRLSEDLMLKICNQNFVSMFGGNLEECPQAIEVVFPDCHKDLEKLVPEKIERDMKVFEKYTRMYTSCLTVRYAEMYPEARKNMEFIDTLKASYKN